MKNRNVRIVMVNWNSKKLTEKAILSIRPFLDTHVELIVVDNNSADGSVNYLSKKKLPCIVVASGSNRGWAGGNNVGIVYQSGFKPDAYLLLSNDVEIDKKDYLKLISALFLKNKIGIVGPKTYFPNNGKIIADAGGILEKNRFFGQNRGSNEYDIGQYDGPSRVDFISGACMLIKKEVFDSIGLFDEEYFLYYEDADFCIRAEKCGFYSYFFPDAIVTHAVSSTVKLGSPIHHYFTTRNHLLFVEKYAPLKVKLKELARLPKTINEFSRSEDIFKKKYSLLGIRDYLLRRFGKQCYW